VTWVLHLLLGVACFLLATIAFDLLHYLLHRCHASDRPLVRRLGSLHQTHHEFLDRRLVSHPELEAGNLRRHVIPEFVTQVLVTALFLPVLPAPAVYVAWGIELMVFLLILRERGYDINHRQVDWLAAYKPVYFCMPEYHYLHHVYPDAHFSSWIKTLDHLLRTGVSLRGRLVLIAGLERDSRRAFEEVLTNAGAKVAELGEGEDRDVLLAAAEILLVQPRPGDDGGGAEALLREYAQKDRTGVAPREVWGLCTPAAASRWEVVTRTLYTCEVFIYRHCLVEDVNPGYTEVVRLVDGVRRGFNLVPASAGWRVWRRALRFLREVRPDRELRPVFSRSGSE